MPFDLIHEIPHKGRYLGVPLHEPPRRIDNRASYIAFPVPFIARTSKTGFGARRTRLRFFCEYPLGLVVIDNCHGVTALALRRAIDASWQIGSELGPVDRLSHGRLTR